MNPPPMSGSIIQIGNSDYHADFNVEQAREAHLADLVNHAKCV